MSRKLQALDNEEIWPLTAGEKSRYLVIAARSDYRGGVQGKSPDRLHRKLDAILDGARTRIKAEEAAEQAEKDRKVRAKAQAKIDRRNNRSFW